MMVKLMDVFFDFKVNDLLEKCNTIWDKVIADIKKENDREPAYEKKSFEKRNKISWP